MSNNDRGVPPQGEGVSRRSFLGRSSAAIAGATAASHSPADAGDDQEGDPSPQPATRRCELSLAINGQQQTLKIDPRSTLVDVLREQLGLFGTKKGCDHGSCGACTVHVDGHRVLACLTMAATLDGAEVNTIEGLSGEHSETLHPMQEAFLRCDAYQCGYCTPGQIMSAVACIDEGHADRSVHEAREWMSGNLCRCSAYPNILAALRQTAGAQPVGDPADDVSRLTSAETPNSNQ